MSLIVEAEHVPKALQECARVLIVAQRREQRPER